MPDLHLLPYSRFSAEDSTLWWLCRTKSKTAFKQGKFVLGKPDRFHFESGIVCGLHIERGVKQNLGNPDWKLGNDWQWNKFITDMQHELPMAVSRIHAIIAEPVDVFVHASATEKHHCDRLKFSSTGNSLCVQSTELNLKVLHETSACTSWNELGRNLELLPTAADWYWIDVFIVARFSLDTRGPDDLGVCVNMFQELEHWLGTSASQKK